MIRVAIIVGSTRPGRKAESVARWVYDIALSLATDFQNYVTFKPAARHDALVATMLDQLISWAVALQTVRSGERARPVHNTTRNEQFKRGAMEQWHDRAIR